jgi:hypothetical protein
VSNGFRGLRERTGDFGWRRWRLLTTAVAVCVCFVSLLGHRIDVPGHRSGVSGHGAFRGLSLVVPVGVEGHVAEYCPRVMKPRMCRSWTTRGSPSRT